MKRFTTALVSLLPTSCFSPGFTVSDTEAASTSSAPVETVSGTTDTQSTSPGLGSTSGQPTETNAGTTTAEGGQSETTRSPTSTAGATETSPTSSDETTETSSGETAEPSECGNGRIEAGETCDDGDDNGTYDSCSVDCDELGPHCGDGIQNGPEQCDDADMQDGNGCNNDCVESGQQIWTHEEHVFDSDRCVDIVSSETGELYSASRITNPTGSGESAAYYSQRLTPDGNVAWSRIWAPSATATQHDYETRAAAAVSDGVVMVGRHRTGLGSVLTAPFTDIPIVKMASGNGDVEWSRSDSFAAFATDVGPDTDGELIVSGWTELGGGGEGVFSRVDDNGDLVGSPSYQPGRFPIKHATFNGGVFVVARSNSIAPLGRLQRKNSGFGTLWDQDVWNNDPFTLTNPLDVAAVDGSGMVAVGVGDPSFSPTPWIVRYDGAGVPEWAMETADFASLGSPNGVALTPEGHVVVAGSREGGPWLARLSTDGETMWSRSLDESGAFYAVTVVGPLSMPVACGSIDVGAEGTNIFVAAYTP